MIFADFAIWNLCRKMPREFMDRLFADQTEVVVTMSPENAWQLPSFYNWDGREAVSKLIVFFGVATKHALMRRCQHVYRHRIQLHKNDTPRKPTRQWKITMLNRRYIFKWLVFHCHVSLLGCKPWKKAKQLVYHQSSAFGDLPLSRLGMSNLWSPADKVCCIVYKLEPAAEIWHFGCSVAFDNMLTYCFW